MVTNSPASKHVKKFNEADCTLQTPHTSIIFLKAKKKVNLEQPSKITGEHTVCEHFILPWPL